MTLGACMCGTPNLGPFVERWGSDPPPRTSEEKQGKHLASLGAAPHLEATSPRASISWPVNWGS